MAAPPRGQALSGREEALAREVAELLKPFLAEIDRRLDRISQRIEDMITQLGSTHALLARLEAAPEAVKCDGVHELRGDQEP